MKIKKGDTVIVIAGNDKGKVGVVEKAFPKLNKVVVNGVNLRKKHQKPRQNNPEGQIVEIYAPIDVSNIAYYDTKAKKASRIGYRIVDGKKVRYSKETDKQID